MVLVCGGVLQARIVSIDGSDCAQGVIEEIEHVIVLELLGLAQSIDARLQEIQDPR